MIDYNTFSALRLRHLFPSDPVLARESTSDPECRDFSTEWLWGLWDDERATGVKLLFPEADGSRVGAVQMEDPGDEGEDPRIAQVASWLGVSLPARPERDRRQALENIGRMLEVLRIPLQFGCGESAIRSLADAAPVKREPGGGGMVLLAFDHGSPDLYWFEALVHRERGLVCLTVIRPDVARDNRSEALAEDEEGDDWE